MDLSEVQPSQNRAMKILKDYTVSIHVRLEHAILTLWNSRRSTTSGQGETAIFFYFCPRFSRHEGMTLEGSVLQENHECDRSANHDYGRT